MKAASWKAAGAAAGRVAISLGTRGVLAGYRKFAPLQPPGWMLKLPGHEFNHPDCRSLAGKVFADVNSISPGVPLLTLWTSGPVQRDKAEPVSFDLAHGLAR